MFDQGNTCRRGRLLKDETEPPGECEFGGPANVGFSQNQRTRVFSLTSGCLWKIHLQPTFRPVALFSTASPAVSTNDRRWSVLMIVCKPSVSNTFLGSSILGVEVSGKYFERCARPKNNNHQDDFRRLLHANTMNDRERFWKDKKHVYNNVILFYAWFLVEIVKHVWFWLLRFSMYIIAIILKKPGLL